MYNLQFYSTYSSFAGCRQLGNGAEEVLARRGGPARPHHQDGQPGHDQGGDLRALLSQAGTDPGPARGGREIPGQPNFVHIQPSNPGEYIYRNYMLYIDLRLDMCITISNLQLCVNLCCKFV